MKFNIKSIALGLISASLAFIGCQEEISPLATAVQTEVPSVTFDAQNAAEQVVNLFADGDWTADVPVEWITVTPTSGRGNTEITISVTDNVKDGAQDSPRSAVVLFRGASIEREGKLTINQKGDTYLGVPESTLSEVAEMERDQVAKITGAQVVAVAVDGFLLSDGTSYMFAQKTDAAVSVGDKLFLNGKTGLVNGFPSFVVDEYDVLQSAEVSHPDALDLTSAVDSYSAEAITYVKIEGTIVGNAVKNIAGAPSTAVNFYTAPASLEMEAVSVHKVVLYAYHIGMSGGAHQLVVVSYKDNGTDDSIGVEFPFKDDFIWLDSYIAAANAVLPAANQIDDVVAKQSSSSDGAANLYTTLANNGCDVLGELRSRGYVDLNPGQKTIYLQDGYLKFGKTDAQSGLTLPLMKIDGEQDIAVQFQWCAHITGSGNVDKTELVVAIEGPGTVVTTAGTSNAKVSDPVKSQQDKNQMFWQDVTVKINGATSGTFITIRPKNEQMGTVNEPKTGQFRYHLDNIKVLLAADLVPAHMEVNGVKDNLITFEGTPEGPASFEVLSDKEFTVETNVDWLSFNQTSGPADMPTVIEVTCAESELSELRQGVISVKSGTSVYKIQVVQSAAGVELQPLISIVGGNSAEVGFAAGSFNLGIQANVEYEFVSDASWVNVEAAPATKAKVEVTELVVNYEANTATAPRTAHIRVFNKAKNIESVYTLTQARYETGVYFSDNFDWLAGMVTASGAGDSMGNNKDDAAKNAYTASGAEGFADALAAQGYEDLLPGTNTIYLQKNYLKFSKTSNTNGIKLPAFNCESGTDAVLSFDWGVHVGSGGADAVEITVELVGNGTVNAVPVPHTAGNWEWQTQKFYLKGIDSNTRVIIKPSTYTGVVDATKTYYRWYIDNIKVAKPDPTVLAAWDLSSAGMTSYADTWGGVDPGTYDKNAGDGGKYITANAAGSGKLTYVQIDKNEIDVNGKARRVCGGTGEPYVEGQWVGDSWNLTATANIPANSMIGASFYSRASGTGMKYWLVEYLDGDTWKPALPTQTVEIDGQTYTYNVNHNNTTEFHIQFAVTTTTAMSEFKIRETCVANAQASGKGALAAPNGGTIRIKGGDLSPVIVMY